MQRAAGVGAGHHGRPGALQGGQLAVADKPGPLGLQHRVGPSGPAAQPVVVEGGRRGDEGLEHLVHGPVGPLHVAEVAGVLHGHRRLRPAGGGRQAVQAGGQPLVNVKDPGREPAGLLGAEQSPVVLERGPAAGRVDQDGGLAAAAAAQAGQAGHRRSGHGSGRLLQPGVGGQGPAAGRGRAGGGDARAGRLDHRLGGRVNGALPGVHDAAGEQKHVGSRRPERGAAQRYRIRQAQTRRGDRPQALQQPQAHRGRPQQPGSGQGGQPEPLPPAGDPPGRGQSGPGALHEPAEGHPGGAGRLASPALHAGLHGADHLVGDRSPLDLHRLHEGDAAARRLGVAARHHIGGAVGQAQPAGHARNQFVAVQPEVHQRRHPRPGPRFIRAAGPWRGSRPISVDCPGRTRDSSGVADLWQGSRSIRPVARGEAPRSIRAAGRG